MNFKNRYLELRAFLNKYEIFWKNEVLNDYPVTINRYPENLIKVLENKTDEELWEIDGKNNPSSLVGSELENILKEAHKLTKIEKEYISYTKLPDWAFRKVKKKKQHEINHIRSLVKSLKENVSFSNLIDIGGGVGNLCRVLSHYESIQSTCLEMNEDFIKIGKLKKNKYPLPQDAKDFDFKKFEFGKEDFEKIKLLFNSENLSLGLHTCGNLANEHIKTFITTNSKAMINFGCCYAKLNPILQTNLSNFSKDHPVDYSIHGLTLATRSHSLISFEDFLLKKRVKQFRYTLHLFLIEKIKLSEFYSVGDANASDYKEPFSFYALKKIKAHFPEIQTTAKELDQFFDSERIKSIVKKMFLANIIRWQFGRSVELSILLDRAIFLKENDKTVFLKEVFNENLSPRNIALISY